MIHEKIEKAKVLLEALPYIKKFFGKTIVIKLGGSVMIDPAKTKQFATDIVLLKYVGINPIIVHGGGKEISKWMEKLGKQAVFIDGLRYTDEETMEMTEMVLSGKINNDLVNLINQSGGNAVGLSGKDGRLFTAEKIKSQQKKDLGLVGEVTDVHPEVLDILTDKGFIPVISSIGTDKIGNNLNINADHVAAKLASALKAMKLIYLTDVKGVIADGRHIQQLDIKDTKKMIKHPDIIGGMLPKLKYSLQALESGVNHIHIINGGFDHSVLLELFTDKGTGTMILGDQ